jgi:hypothetical protein
VSLSASRRMETSDAVCNAQENICIWGGRPPLWSSGQSVWLQIQRSRVRFAALPDFLRSRVSIGTIEELLE